MTNEGAARISQDLTSFIAAGTITQALLDDPNTVLRNASAGLNITGGTQIDVTTAPSAPLFGDGNDIAFLTAVRRWSQTQRGSGLYRTVIRARTYRIPGVAVAKQEPGHADTQSA